MTKSRTLRKAGAVVLSLAMAFSVAGVAPSADAAAKKPALSAKKGTITVGNKKAVKIKNTTAKKVKKLVVSSNKKTVATVKKNSKVKFTVTGKKAGTAKITATVTLKKAVAKKKVYTLKYTAKVKKAATTPTEAPVVDVTGVTLSNSTPKVGDTETAILAPAGASNVASYAWFTSASTDTTAEWTAITGATSATYKVTSAEVGKFIKVVVTDKDGKTFEAVTTAAVAEDASSDVSIIDTYGLQSDGTGIIGDVLRLSYGASFGTVTTVSWYRNGSVLITSGSGNDGIAERDGGLTLEVTALRGTGTYKATVVADGKTYETNEIEITDKEDAAVIKSFTLENDYTDGFDIDYGTTDNKAVATVTMNKNYDGRFRVYRATDTTFKTALATDTLVTSTVTADKTAATAIGATGNTAGTGPVADETSVLTTNAATNYQVLTANRIGSGYGFINNDGTVTYKWVLDDTGVERGAEYVVAFDQDSISSDTPGTGKANVSDKATAPYVTAPAKIAVTKVAQGVKPEITFQDADGATLAWFGYERTASVGTREVNINAPGKTELQNVAGSSAQIYASTNKTNDPKASGVSIIASGVTNRAVAAVDDTVEKGVWSSVAVAGNQAYFFATVTFLKGVFGADALTLTSEAAATAQPAATDMSIFEDKDTATSAVVKFANLRASGTVYVARGRFDGAGNDNTTNVIDDVSEIVDAFKADNSSTYVASSKVEAGTASVTIPNAIGGYTGAHAGTIPADADDYVVNGNTGSGNNGISAYASGTTYGTDDYVAIFVPDDTANYGQISTSAVMTKDPYTVNETTGTWNSLRITSVPKTIGYDKTDATRRATIELTDATNTIMITGQTLLAKDQFGYTVRNAITDAQNVTSATFTAKDVLTGLNQAAVGTYTITNAGVVRLSVKAKDGMNYAAVGDKYTVTILGSTITLTAMNAVAQADRSAAQGLLDWDAKFGSDNLQNNDEAVTLNGLALTVATAGGKTTITVGGTAGTVTATSSVPTNTSVALSGRTVTLTYVQDGAANTEIVITGSNFVRTVTYEDAAAAGSDPVGVTFTSTAITAAP